MALERNKTRPDNLRHGLAMSYGSPITESEFHMETFLAVSDSDMNFVWILLGVLAIIALFMFILGARR